MLHRLNVSLANFVFTCFAVLFFNFLLRRHIDNKWREQADFGKLFGSVVIYNRIPKTGSTTLTNTIAYDLCEINGFHAIHLNMTRNRFMANAVDQGILVRNISMWSELLPAFYHGHVAFIDFTKYGYSNPIYINMVREPFERLLSHYYFLRSGDDYRVGLKRSRAGNNETFDECLLRNGRDCDPKQLWLQIPYFCGTSSFCSEVGNEKALERAKWNLVNHYLIVGLTERMTDMVAVLEHLLPNFFVGALNHFRTLNERRSHLRHTKLKIAPSASTNETITQNRIYKMERDFYDFAAAEFDNIFKHLFDAENQILKNQFHYEKIRP